MDVQFTRRRLRGGERDGRAGERASNGEERTRNRVNTKDIADGLREDFLPQKRWIERGGGGEGEREPLATKEDNGERICLTSPRPGRNGTTFLNGLAF